jgi:hypothetical protein
MAMMIPDPIRKWVKGTAFITSADEYNSDGQCIGSGTREVTEYGRACGITYATPICPFIIKLGEDDPFSIFYQ